MHSSRHSRREISSSRLVISGILMSPRGPVELRIEDRRLMAARVRLFVQNPGLGLGSLNMPSSKFGTGTHRSTCQRPTQLSYISLHFNPKLHCSLFLECQLKVCDCVRKLHIDLLLNSPNHECWGRVVNLVQVKTVSKYEVSMHCSEV